MGGCLSAVRDCGKAERVTKTPEDEGLTPREQNTGENPDFKTAIENNLHLTLHGIEKIVDAQKLNVTSCVIFPYNPAMNTEIECGIYVSYIGTQLHVHLLKSHDGDNQLLKKLIEIIKDVHAKLKITVFGFAGDIPTKTSYLQQVKQKISQDDVLKNANIVITTSHSTTLATMVMNIKYILHDQKRSLQNEIVGMLGCGSIGTGAILSLLASVPKSDLPKKIILCDKPGRQENTDKLKKKIIELYPQLNDGEYDEMDKKEEKESKDSEKSERVVSVTSPDEESVHEQLYSCTLIIGATNKPNVLDVNQCNQGTILCDDSSPHCFHVKSALARKGEVIFSDCGVAKLRERTKLIIDHKALKRMGIKIACECEYSCALGTLLTQADPIRSPGIVGMVDWEQGIKQMSLMKELGIQGTYYLIDSEKRQHEYKQLFKVDF